MKRKNTFILLTIFAGSAMLAHAQTDCSQSLMQAERAYYTGKFSEVQPMLAPCLASGFDKDQETEAYKLIALSAIFSKNFSEADSALMNMLKNNPQYEFTVQDPPEFRKRVEDFGVHPVVEVTVNAGLIQPFLKVTEVYNTRAIPATVTYKGKAGAHIGLSAAYYINKKISIRTGFEFQRYSFTAENKDSLNTQLLTEAQSRSQLQASLGYSFQFRKISLQVYGGMVYSSLKKADGYLVLDRENASGEIDFSYSNLSQRTKNEIRPLLEMKLNVPQKNNWMFSLSMRYEMGITNMTNGENRLESLNRATQFEWLEDDFKGSYLVMAFGVSKLFYNIKLK